MGILLHPWGCDVDDDECCGVRKGILPYFDVEAQLVKQPPITYREHCNLGFPRSDLILLIAAAKCFQ